MPYETILVELLSRIQKLEDDVNELRRIQSGGPPTQEAIENSHEGLNVRESTVSHQRMTDEMIDLCYYYGKKAAAGENVQDLADEIVGLIGMNRNSAIMYLYAVQCMLEGKIYKRAISAKATKKYFDAIFEEYGRTGLRKAIQATRLHIVYRRECGHNVDSIEELCNACENRR